jgi:hypothetical protein
LPGGVYPDLGEQKGKAGGRSVAGDLLVCHGGSISGLFLLETITYTNYFVLKASSPKGTSV